MSPLRQINNCNAGDLKNKNKLPRAAQFARENIIFPSLYIAKFPLVGFEMVENLPPIFSDPAALHVALIIECVENGIWLFDFLPENPTNPLILARLLSNGGGVPGQARSRHLKTLPRQRCRAAGASVHLNAVDRARAMGEKWDKSELKLFKRDCRHFVNALVSELT
jgi:hypothetical protein